MQKQTNLAAVERARIANELKVREQFLTEEKRRRDVLARQMEDMQSKVIVGGVNLLEKAEEQERLLDEAQRELQIRKQQEAHLEVILDVHTGARLFLS